MRILKGTINIHKDLKKNVNMERWGMKDIKNQIELLELKNTTPERKNSLAGFNSRLDMVEKKNVCDIEDITIEPIQTKTHREKA